MIVNQKKLRQQNNRGFTLIEVIIAVAITGVIMTGITTGIIQLLTINNQNTNSITAQRQVQQVGYAMSTDGVQARSIIENVGGNAHLADTNPFSWPIKYSWIDNNGVTHDTVYTLSGGVVSRSETFGATTINKNIATDISTAVFSRTGNGTYRLVITAVINGKFTVTETRTYDIKMRAQS
jgi:prepilin-type N-terminal cleavage/methylation domain-containing protein